MAAGLAGPGPGGGGRGRGGVKGRAGEYKTRLTSNGVQQPAGGGGGQCDQVGGEAGGPALLLHDPVSRGIQQRVVSPRHRCPAPDPACQLCGQ